MPLNGMSHKCETTAFNLCYLSGSHRTVHDSNFIDTDSHMV